MTTNEPPLAAYYLGLLGDDERDEVERSLRDQPDLQQRVAIWPNALAAVTCAALVIEDLNTESRLEQRLVQRARTARPPAVRSRRLLRTAARGTLWMILAAAIAVSVVFGYLAFRADDPISGRPIALTDDGATGVLLPTYNDQLFALIFWGLPTLEAGQTWQLWLVRASGAVEPGATFTGDDEGRAAVSFNPRVLESSDPLIGFAVSQDNPSERSDDRPSSDDILYQFPFSP